MDSLAGGAGVARFSFSALGRCASSTAVPAVAPHYVRYLPLPRDIDLWGVAITAAGYTRVPPGSPYPVGEHASDHQFTWDAGRKLDAYQLIFVEAGQGTFECRPKRAPAPSRPAVPSPAPIAAGAMFMLFPGVWHRYKPSVETGWTESWVELQGPLLERLRKRRLLSPDKALSSASALPAAEGVLREIHGLIRRQGSAATAELSALATRMLALWTHPVSASVATPHMRAIAEAEAWLSDNLSERIDMPALAARVGLGYTHFRRVFKEITGMAPWQYVIRLRLMHARRLLACGDTTLEALAEQLGFSSAFHLSSSFKRHVGRSPSAWKRSVGKS